MIGGPIGSGYPGTPVAIIMVAFCALLFGRSVLSVFRRRRDDAIRQGYGADVVVAIIAAYLFVMMLWAILIHK
jgi:hypothetical protein